MHELGIAQEVVALVAADARGTVTRVVLEIGKLSAVLPEAIRFCFDLCSDGTVVAGAELDIVLVPGRRAVAHAGPRSYSNGRSAVANAAAATWNG